MAKTGRPSSASNGPRGEIVPLPWVARRRSRAAAGQPESELRDPDDYAVSTRTLVLIGAFLVAFVVASVWLLDTMRKNALIEECVMAGRKNCTPIVVPPRER